MKTNFELNTKHILHHGNLVAVSTKDFPADDPRIISTSPEYDPQQDYYVDCIYEDAEEHGLDKKLVRRFGVTQIDLEFDVPVPDVDVNKFVESGQVSGKPKFVRDTVRFFKLLN